MFYLCIYLLNDYFQLSNKFTKINLPSLLITTFLISAGFLLGFIFFKLSNIDKLPKKYSSKHYFAVISQIMTIIFIGAVFSSYLFKGQNLESNIYTVLFIIEVPFFFSLIPMIGIYSIFKKAKKTFLISALMIIFFLLLLISIKLLNISTYSFSINNLFLTILSFIISIIYLELGMKTTDFDLIVNRITNNKKHKNESLLIGFNTFSTFFSIYFYICKY